MRMPLLCTARKDDLPKEISEVTSKPSGGSPRTPRLRRGKWAGLTAGSIAKLMGCSTWTAKRWLYKSKPVDLEEVGILICVYKSERERRALGKLLGYKGFAL